jgi:hypothetical protein
MSLRNKVVHYAEIFGVAFGITLLFNAENLLNAHGLSAVKSAAVAAVVAGAKAGIDALKAKFKPTA